MIFAGLDVGSRTTKLVLLEEGSRSAFVVETGANPLKRSLELLSNRKFDCLMVTGYGRHLVSTVIGGKVISEISAFAVGARSLFSQCSSVIDIGGQDSKVIRLNEKGDIHKFEMNDRCAAGTGKFLEVMAHSLETDIRELGALALSANKTVNINSLCTVFAESEVVSLIARGEKAPAIALGVHEAIAIRIATMAKRVGLKDKVVFAGGAAQNICLKHLLEQKLGMSLSVPEQPQILGALGAALLARFVHGHSSPLI